MITDVSIRCQKNPEVGIRRIPAYTPQYTTGYTARIVCRAGSVKRSSVRLSASLSVCPVILQFLPQPRRAASLQLSAVRALVDIGSRSTGPLHGAQQQMRAVSR